MNRIHFASGGSVGTAIKQLNALCLGLILLGLVSTAAESKTEAGGLGEMRCSPLLAGVHKVEDWHLAVARKACAVATDGQKIYVTGGVGVDDTRLADVIEIDCATGVERVFAALKTARAFHASVIVGTKLYVIGGLAGDEQNLTEMDAALERRSRADPFDRLLSSIEVIDLLTGAVSDGPEMQFGRSNHSAVAIDNSIYICGGRRYYQGKWATTARCERFNLTTSTWDDIAPLPRPLQGAACQVGRQIVFAGGFDGAFASDAVYCYKVDANEWVSLRRLAAPQSATAVAVMDRTLLLFGNYSRPEDVTAYDLVDQMSFDLDVDYVRARFAAAVSVGDRVMVVGGAADGSRTALGLVQVYGRPSKRR